MCLAGGNGRRRLWEFYMVFYLVHLHLASGLSWVIGGHLREALAIMIWYLPNYSPLISLSHRVVGPLFATIWPTILHLYIISRWPDLVHTTDRRLFYLDLAPLITSIQGVRSV